MVAVFVVSLLVSVITCAMTYLQTESYIRQYTAMMESSTSGREGDHLPYGQSPPVLRSWFAQGLDVATNFPTALLTAVAFSDLSPEAFEPYAYLVVGVMSTAGAIALARPSVAPKYYRLNNRKWLGISFRYISIVSAFLILLNAVGLGVALHMG